MATPNASSAPALTFTFSSQALRVIMRDGEPWFVAADVCAALTIGNVTDALKRLDDDEQTLVSIEGQAGNGAQSQNLINESGLYSLILGSRKPEAKKFKKWVTSEVLPAIRKTGRYVAPQAQPPVKASEHINGKDLQNIKRMIWFCTRVFHHDSAWVQGIWFYLRKVLGVPTPYPFSVDHLPRLASELHRIAAITDQVQDIIREVENQAVKRIFRKGEDADVVLADLRRLATERAADIADDRAKLPSWLHTDVAAITNRYQHMSNEPTYVEAEKPGYFDTTTQTQGATA